MAKRETLYQLRERMHSKPIDEIPLAELRRLSGVGIATASHVLGIQQAAIRRYERGEGNDPSNENRIKSFYSLCYRLKFARGDRGSAADWEPSHTDLSLREMLANEGSTGDRIRVLRELHGLSQLDLGRRIGIKRERVIGLETASRRLTAYEAVVIADIFSVSIDYVITGR